MSLTAHALLLSGQVLALQGETDAAGERFESCLRLSREAGDKWALMRVLEALARWYHAQENDDRAQTCLAEATTLARESGDRKTLGKVLESRARLAAAAGDDPGAVRLLAEADELQKTHGFARMPRQQRDFDGLLESLRERLGGRFSELWPEAHEASEVVSGITNSPSSL